MAEAKLAIDVRNALGDGPIWHALRQRLIWFDVLNHCMFLAKADGSELVTYGFGEPVSAAFPENDAHVLVAAASGLWRVNLDTNHRELVAGLDARGEPARAGSDLHSGGNQLWFGAAPRTAVSEVGVLYRVRDGEDSRMFGGMDVPSAICFSPDGRRSYFCDQDRNRIMTCICDPDTGLPSGKPEVFVDLSADGLTPDGAVVDAEGYLWNAQCGAGRVVRYSPSGVMNDVVQVAAPLTTCLCFGGTDLKTLFITTACQSLSPGVRAVAPLSGAVFSIDVMVPGNPEPMIKA
jgi:sugar lactone lactonase YvrE